MSHFSVLVLHAKDDSFEDLLAPFDENLEVKPYLYIPHEKAIEEMEQGLATLNPDVQEKYKAMSETDRLRSYFGGIIDEEGNIWSTYNPQSRWDWYSVGGRWGKHPIPLKDGSSAVECPVSEIDFGVDQEEYDKALKYWEETATVGKDSFFNAEYFLLRYKDAETYAKSQSQFSTHAIVTPDGKWIEKGKMGWFAYCSATPEEEREWDENYEALVSKYKDYVATFIDCHI